MSGPSSPASDPPGKGNVQCDFCGRAVARVRRVALDRGYDRLSRRHAVRYACPECSELKDAERQPPVDASSPSV